jgi:hypothetical protein
MGVHHCPWAALREEAIGSLGIPGEIPGTSKKGDIQMIIHISI